MFSIVSCIIFDGMKYIISLTFHLYVSIIITDQVVKKERSTAQYTEKRSEHLDRKMPAKGQQIKKKRGGMPSIDEALGSDSSKVSYHDSLNVSQSQCQVKQDKQNAKMGVAQGSKYQPILSDSSGK